jgi:sulfide:quinone oxidoreductase
VSTYSWTAHRIFLRDLLTTDNEGFVVNDLLMRNPDYSEVFAAGDAAAVTVPKLGAIGHQQCEIIGKQIASDLGIIGKEKTDEPLHPVVLCIGDIGNHQAFYIRSNTLYGGDTAILKMGYVPYMLKSQYKSLFFNSHVKIPAWGVDAAQVMAERSFAALG